MDRGPARRLVRGKLGLSLPIGISFYTFQTMSYTIDVYRDDAKVQRSLVNFGTFVTLFPQLIAGPIIKYKDLGDQIDHRTHSPEQFASGVQIFVVGLAKKVLLANNIGKLWDTILALPAGGAHHCWGMAGRGPLSLSSSTSTSPAIRIWR